jgi:hypothetical protein
MVVCASTLATLHYLIRKPTGAKNALLENDNKFGHNVRRSRSSQGILRGWDHQGGGRLGVRSSSTPVLSTAYTVICDHVGGSRRNPLSEIRLVTFESEAGSGKIHAAEHIIGYDQDLQ